jgi:hypothetical protein
VVAELRERLSISKQAAQDLDTQKFDLKELNYAEVTNNVTSKYQTGLYL